MELCFHDECPICFEHMRDRFFFTKLDCGHIFCNRCVEKLRSETRHIGFFLCPYCRRAQHNSKCCITRYANVFYYRYHNELSLCISICLWILAMVIFVTVIVLIDYYSSQH